MLFFAFAGYARIATLGEEVTDPVRTIPRAISLALGIALVVYLLVALAAAGTLGIDGLAASSAYLMDTAGRAGHSWLVPIVAAGTVVAAVGSLLSLILGVSRTALAMARDGYLPRALAVVDVRRGVPRRLEAVVGVVVAVLAATADLRGAIGFSSFTVLAYYAIANVSAATLGREENRPARWVWLVGFAGCVALAVALPIGSVLAGLLVVAIGVAAYPVQERVRRHRRRPG